MKHIGPFVAELIGTFTLVFVGIGVIFHHSSEPLTVALAHGLAIAVMVSATMHISGGMLNPAVTLGVLVSRRIDIVQAAVAWAAQLLGAIVAAFICLRMWSQPAVIGGTPALRIDLISPFWAIVVEGILTFFLVFVVFGTGVDERGRKIGGLAIGLTIVMGILVAGRSTGGALNPARAFGPALVSSYWTYHYVYWLGPMIGGALAGLIYSALYLRPGSRPA